jgi:serine/threonine protein phosphatase PrpC
MNILQKLFAKKPVTEPPLLPMEEPSDMGGVSISVGSLTDKGRVREHNEDALFTLNAVLSQEEDLVPMCFYVVADGMGGHEGGEEASALAVRIVANWVLDKIYRPFLTEVDLSANRQPINQVLTEAIVVANGKVHERCPEGGTTLTCALIMGTNAFLAHVGDSRAYLISRGTIRQLTTDHSLVNRLIELGQITPEEAKTHPQKNVLYRALGRAGNLEVDTYLQSLPDSSTVLLCSDGLWGMVPEEAMLSIIEAAPSPQVACARLVSQANENGGEDNITAVLIKT